MRFHLLVPGGRCDGYPETGFVGKALQFTFPETDAGAVAAAAIGRYGQGSSLGIAFLAEPLPPAANALDGKFGGIGIDPDIDPPLVIRAASDEIERGRRIPLGIAAAMNDAGVFGMAMQRVWGGPELDPLTQFRVIEALAMADGSVGWCAMIGGGYVTAFLDQDRSAPLLTPTARLRREKK
jgi:hypothetical protein